jgi:hypothetical protein
MLGAARGFSILRKTLATAPLAGHRPGLFIFTAVMMLGGLARMVLPSLLAGLAPH